MKEQLTMHVGAELPPELATWLQDVAKAEDRSVSSLLRIIVAAERKRRENDKDGEIRQTTA